MARSFKRVAVLGAGVMGSGIAAHLANAGVRVLLLDIIPPNLSEAEKNDRKARNRFAQSGLDKAVKSKPAAFMDKEDAALVEIGNIEDDLPRINECDWAIEVAPENLKIKQALFQRMDSLRKPGLIITSNTSGIPIAQMTEGRSADFRKHFFVTHFFNPVRYMKLLELVAGPETDHEIFQAVAAFGERKLGKGIVYGRDTPNFVGNRIGVFSMLNTIHAMLEMDYTPEEVDAIAGPPLGRPKSAAFRTADLVGLDTFAHVAQNCYDNLVNDERRDAFILPDFVKDLIAKGNLGDKSGKGFYAKVGKDIQTFDPKTREYRPKIKPDLPSIKEAKNIEDDSEKLRHVVYNGDRAGVFAWRITADSLIYSANRMNEIAGDVFNMDNAMKWGFNWDLGPFETWDAIGVRKSVEKMKAEGRKIPAWVEEMLAAGFESFYKSEYGVRYYYDPAGKGWKAARTSPEIIFLPSVKERKKNVWGNSSVTLVDLGDGVLNLEFHTKMNTVDDELILGMHNTVDRLENEGWTGLVIGNNGEHFSAGANLMLVFMNAQSGNFKDIETMVDRFQHANKRMRECSKPVVAAPFGLTLGGGAEVVFGANRVRASSELYMGLVEIGVGLLPGGGGTMEMAFRALGHIPNGVEANQINFIRKYFENVGMAKVSTSGKEAMNLGYLRPTDSITMNRDYLLADAKNMVLGMAKEGFAPPRERTARFPGQGARATFDMVIYSMFQSHNVSEHDMKILKKIGYVMTGGDCSPSVPRTETHILELEKEAFMSLVGEPKTMERMQYMLMNNKPLRN
ncbi:MAG: putative 3-hydroxyacyl-CoA dehydrogenase [Myxococcota bacterium]|nr:putative 3-hydroxyacyl-CoA dehydrogenase [Myxococcota bacterium]